MKKKGAFLAVLLIAVAAVVMVYSAAAQDSTATQEADATEEATGDSDPLLERGRYLAQIGACIDCHTPYKPEFADFSAITPEQLQQLGLYTLDTQDTETMLLAGGRPFDLGPAGVLFSRNITPDEETGIGLWTDQEIENAVRIGVRPDGSRLHPLMPYRNLYNLSREDMTALIAFLRSVPAIKSEVPRTMTGDGIAPELVPNESLLETAPDGSDPVALGEYLVNVVMACSDCHTPLDPETGAPLMEQYLAGGQPYEGPWGIVYGANITPDETTGIGTWTAEDIERVFREGVRVDHRRLVLMPWQAYSAISDDDLAALITYLKEGVAPVTNEIPLPSIEELFLVIEEGE
jgi:mono/diheme cytochrome c family protein